MRVLVMVHGFPGRGAGFPEGTGQCAGAEMTAFVLLRHLAARGHTVDVVLSSQTGPPYVLDGLNVWPYENQWQPLEWFDGLRRADLVVTYLDNTIRASILCRMHAIPCCHLIHNTFDFSKQAVMRGPADLVTYHADWVQADYEQTFADWGYTPDPNSVSVMVHPSVGPAEYATKPGNKVTLINIWPNKGSELFWQLAELMPDIEFLGVMGGYGEQDLRDPCPPNVEVVPHTPAARMRDEVFARTRILLMPSLYESYGRCAVEAACSGIPTLAHPTPGLREALGPAGIFCDRDNPDEWVKSIRHLAKPRIAAEARKKALALAAAQDPQGDMDRWCDVAEEVARCGSVFAGINR